MRSRIGCGIALGLLAGLGGTGCATSKPRPEAPPRFGTWNAPAPSKSASAGPGTAKGPGSASNASTIAPANRPAFPWSEPTGPARTTLSGWNWRYRPGSLFRKFAKPLGPAAPASPQPGSDGTLAKFFPGLYGQGLADPARLAAARRPPRAPSVVDGPVVTTRATRSSASGSVDEVATLPVAIEARAYPGPPSAAIDGMMRLARRDPPGSADGQLTSHEEAPAPAPPTPRPRPRPQATARPGVSTGPRPRASDMDDAVSAELGLVPAAPTATPRPVATADPAGRRTSASVRVPAGALRLAGAGSVPADAAECDDDGPDLRIEPLRAVPTTRPRPAVASTPERPRSAPAALPMPSGRPRLVRVEPMELPPPEFPATYHTESIRRVLRDPGPGLVDLDARPASIELPAPRTPLLPRLAKLWPRPDDQARDVTVTPTSARRDVSGPSR